MARLLRGVFGRTSGTLQTITLTVILRRPCKLVSRASFTESGSRDHTLPSDPGSSLAGQTLTRGESLARETTCKHSGREHKTMPQLEVFREDIPRAQFQCHPCMHAHDHCILHRLNVCGMQCTQYYIGYLLSIKTGWVILLSN